ncbi:MAG: CBS domain-containing protein [Chitinophagales bacterium]
MKISASIYSNKSKDLAQIVRELDAHDIDMFHVDCRDDLNVFEDIRQIRSLSSTPIDLHIISAEPEKFLPAIQELKIEYVSFQYENLKELPKLPKGSATKYGLAICSPTGLDAFEQTNGDFDFVLMMATVPGQSGGTFQHENFQKIIEFKNRFPKKQIHVDGGVNAEIAFILRLLGAHAIVSGSYLMNHESLGQGMLSLHRAPGADKIHPFVVADFATPLKYLPVIKEGETNFTQVLQTIEKYGQGFALVTDGKGELKGVISNADVRRGLLKNLGDMNGVQSKDVINSNPVSISETASLHDMIRLLNSLSFIVLFLPVVDAENHLKGAVLLNQLTRV